MKASEAIEKMKNMRLFMQITDENSEHKFPEDYYKANEMAIQALEEVQQYRSIGTLEECREAVDKQKADKELESHDENHILKSCLGLMQEMVNDFAEWYRWQHL